MNRYSFRDSSLHVHPRCPQSLAALYVILAWLDSAACLQATARTSDQERGREALFAPRTGVTTATAGVLQRGSQRNSEAGVE